jgi:hypothetical protein
MNHPERDEWIPFLFGEAPTETKKRLRQHLDACPSCTREVEAWRRSLHRLDHWRLPKPQRPPVVFMQPTLKWAMAAVLVLGLGFLGGRLNSSGAADLRAQIEASVRSSVQTELTAALLDAQEQNTKVLHATELRLAQASALERERLWRGFLQVLANARSEDAKAVQAAFQHLQEHNDTEFVALRKDLETLASATDDEIRAARVKLYELASAASR